MDELSAKQRRYLRGKAHALAPVVHVGRQGVTGPVRAQAREALAIHELIKVRLAADRPERGEQAEALAVALDAVLVTCIGKVAILYRSSPEDGASGLDLPDS